MRNYFVCVYAISRNEEKFVDRWMDAMGEADRVVVLDTGSEDGTVERLRPPGAEPLPGAGAGGGGHLRVYRSG